MINKMTLKLSNIIVQEVIVSQITSSFLIINKLNSLVKFNTLRSTIDKPATHEIPSSKATTGGRQRAAGKGSLSRKDTARSEGHVNKISRDEASLLHVMGGMI